jgi:uncharacterized protein (DUF2252 family)
MSTARKSEDIDAVEQIAVFNAQWESRLLSRKFDTMAHDASSFLRATSHLFYDRLKRVPLPPSPLVFGCGDLHLENFGAYVADNELAYFDMHEFDEAALMPLAVEMVRFLASILVAIRLHEPDDLDPKPAAKRALEAYASALAGGKPQWIERELARGPIADLLAGVSRRTQRDKLDLFSRASRHGRRRLLRDGRRSAALPKETGSLEAAVKSVLGTIGKARGERGFWKLRDLAENLTDKGRLGKPRYVALIKGHGDPDGNLLLDIKSAWPSAAPTVLGTLQPAFADAAERVVFAQSLMQARAPAFLQPASIGGEPFVLRELQPTEDCLEIDALVARPRRLAAAIETLARIAAWDQLRAAGRKGAADTESLIAFGTQDEWQRELLEAAGQCATEVERDYASFEAAWRNGDTSLTVLAGPR